MDGTTRATDYCSFLATPDTSWLSSYWNAPASADTTDPLKRPTKFGNRTEESVVFNKVINVAARMNRRGFFKKPWILMPINDGNVHWVFLALLNVACLGTDQDQKFSGFFLYDSMGRGSSREKMLTFLHNKGILNLIVYINLVYGSPNIRGNSIRDIIFDPKRFCCITVPDKDYVEQMDTFNCGLFNWLCMVEVSLVHSGKYTQKKDFATAVSSTGDLFYTLQEGDWFILFREPTSTAGKSPTSDRLLRSRPTPSPIPRSFFNAIRKNAQCLFNRIMTFKAMGDTNYTPRFPSDCPFPKFFKANWRRLVWQIRDDEQLAIQNYQKWLEGNHGELSKLLNCKNPIAANSDVARTSDSTAEEKEEEIDVSATTFTTTELKKAGMYVDLFGDGTSPTKPSSVPGGDEKKSEEKESQDDNEKKPPANDNKKKPPANDNKKKPPANDWKSLTLQQSGRKPPAAKPPQKEPRSQQKNKSKKRRRRRTNDEDSDADDSKSTGSVVPEWEPGEKRVTEDSIFKIYGGRTEKDYPHAQRKLDKAKEYISKHIVNLPNTKSDLETWTFKERKSRTKRSETLLQRQNRVDEANENWTKFEPHKEIEAQLHLWDSIKSLQYVPAENNVLAGSFNATTSFDGSIINLSARWVKKHFAEDVVKLVVEKGLDTFIDVHPDVQVSLDLRQIRKLRWNVVPAGQVDSDGNPEESFFDGVTADGMVCKLDQQFVWSNFPKAFVNKVVTVGESSTRKFVFVPSGAPRTREGHEMMDVRYPKVEFLQHGRATCLFSSFASALSYVGINDTAMIFASNAIRFGADSEEGVHNWKAILHIMQESCRFLQPKKINAWTADILLHRSIFPTVVALEDCQGGTHHAITIVGGIIFDSNCERALPLTIKSLDYCCSTDTRPGKFRKVHKGYRFVEDKNKKNKIYAKIATQRGTNFFMEDTNSNQDDRSLN